jgi:hypothetical protein
MSMSFRRRSLTLLLPALAAIAIPARALAQSAAAPDGARAVRDDGQPRGGDSDALISERARLRLELGRVNAEIDRLKKADRGLGADYRLRARLADAEAIARRLTEIDARLLQRGPAPGAASVPRLGTEPGIAPTDGPAELEAKADILADQAKRVQGEARALATRAADLRGRRELRRRSGELEHDPFAPLEGSKRRAMTGTSTTARGGTTGITRDGALPAASPASPAASVPAGAAGTPSVYLRDILDAGTLAEIRKLEQGRTPSSDIEAIERAVAALEQKARYLDTQSQALRQKAAPHR